MRRTVLDIMRDVRDAPLWQGLILLLAGALSATLGGWIIDSRPPLEMLSATVVNSVVVPGDFLLIHYEVDRHRSCAVKLDRTLFDGARIRYVLEDVEYAAAPGPIGHDEFTAPIQIPQSFSQGRGTYSVITRYECNLLHRLWPIVQRMEIRFEVRRPSEGNPSPVVPVR